MEIFGKYLFAWQFSPCQISLTCFLWLQGLSSAPILWTNLVCLGSRWSFLNNPLGWVDLMYTLDVFGCVHGVICISQNATKYGSSTMDASTTGNEKSDFWRSPVTRQLPLFNQQGDSKGYKLSWFVHGNESLRNPNPNMLTSLLPFLRDDRRHV